MLVLDVETTSEAKVIQQDAIITIEKRINCLESKINRVIDLINSNPNQKAPET